MLRDIYNSAVRRIASNRMEFRFDVFCLIRGLIKYSCCNKKIFLPLQAVCPNNFFLNYILEIFKPGAILSVTELHSNLIARLAQAEIIGQSECSNRTRHYLCECQTTFATRFTMLPIRLFPDLFRGPSCMDENSANTRAFRGCSPASSCFFLTRFVML